MRSAAALVGALSVAGALLAGCDAAMPDPPASPDAAETQALDAAAEMLDARPEPSGDPGQPTP